MIRLLRWSHFGLQLAATTIRSDRLLALLMILKHLLIFTLILRTHATPLIVCSGVCTAIITAQLSAIIINPYQHFSKVTIGYFVANILLMIIAIGSS